MTTIERAITIFLLAVTIVMTVAIATTDVPNQEPKPEISTALYCERVGWDVAGEPIVECIESP